MKSVSLIDRRDFLFVSGFVAGGFLSGCRFFRKSSKTGSAEDREEWRHINAWVNLSSKGRVSVIADKIEMGQGTLGLFVGIVADAFDMSPQLIAHDFAPPAEIYVNRKITATVANITLPLKVQFTGYSTSTADAWDTFVPNVMLAKAKLIAAASRQMDIDRSRVKLKDGFAWEVGGKGRKLSLGELAYEASLVENNAVTASAYEPRQVQRTHRPDVAPKVLGTAKFGIDVGKQETGVSTILTAVLVRSWQIGAKIQAKNLETVAKLPGVVAVFPILNNTAYAVVARRYWLAKKASEFLQFDVSSSSNAKMSSDQITSDYLDFLNRKGGVRIPLDLGLGTHDSIQHSGSTHEAQYVLPFLPHSTLEPQNATCSFLNGKWKVWAPNQFPEAAQSAAARVVGVKESQVEIVSTLVGGGFGRRLQVDFVAQVCAIGLELKKKGLLEDTAVKLIWSREEDFAFDFFRPIACHAISASLDKNGIAAWKQEIATQSVTASATTDYVSSLLPDKLKNQKLISLFSMVGKKVLGAVNVDPVSFEGAADSAYRFPKYALTAVGYPVHQIPKVPVGYWRSVGHSHTAFAIESFIDELAKKHGRDAVELRRNALMRQSPNSTDMRPVEVLNRCVALSSYKTGIDNGSALGLARHSGWGSHVAMVLRVRLNSDGSPRVEKVWAVVDVGYVVQPDSVRQQVEGGIIFALSAALKQEIHIEKGEVLEKNFYDSGDILRLSESPEIEVEIIDRPPSVKPTGVGELPVPCIAPALANAIANLTGKRVRRLPITAEAIQRALIFVVFVICGLLSPSGAFSSTDVGGLQAFEHLHKVATSPRCVNCHGKILEDGRHVPLVGEKSLPHPMNIDSRFPALGGKCTTCHQVRNSALPRFPPGAANDRMPGFLWHMPPPSMILNAKMTKKQLCELWTDPNRNAKTPGERGSLADLPKFRKEFMHHVEDDPLVHWAFSPDPGRAPAPGDVPKLVAAMDTWIKWLESGGNCNVF